MILLYVMGMVVGGADRPFDEKYDVPRQSGAVCDGAAATTGFPAPKAWGCCMWDKAKDFLTRAFTVIFVATIIIWFLQSFDIRFNVVADSSTPACWRASAVGHCAHLRAAGLWRLARLHGSASRAFTAKEAVVSTMAVLTGTTVSTLGEALGAIFSPLASVQLFDVHALLYSPCVAAIAAVRTGNALRLGRGVRGAVPVCGGLGVRLPGVPDLAACSSADACISVSTERYFRMDLLDWALLALVALAFGLALYKTI